MFSTFSLLLLTLSHRTSNSQGTGHGNLLVLGEGYKRLMDEESEERKVLVANSSGRGEKEPGSGRVDRVKEVMEEKVIE